MIDERYMNDLKYSALDSAATYQIMEGFWKELYSQGYEDIYDHTIELLNPLMFMMTRGIAVNKDNLAKAVATCKTEIEEKQDKLDETVGRYLNPLSPKQVANYFYVEKNIAPYTNKEGKPTTDDKALTRLFRGTGSRRGLPSAKLIQELRGLHKLSGTYLEMGFDADGRFRTSCNPRGTKFGRISTGKTIYGTGMNMQNLPEAFKCFLVPDPGYIMFELDKRQAEWVIVAYASSDASMINVLENNKDPHTHTASLMFNADAGFIVRENKIVGHQTDAIEIERIRRKECPEIYDMSFVPRIFSMRQAGKKSNHALNYDETYKMFAIHNEMTEAESKVIVEKYHRIYPGIRQWHSFIQTQLSKSRILKNCFGRKCQFLERWGSDLFKQAYAYLPQSTVADIVNRALVDIYKDTDPRMMHLEILAQVHDSILFQMPLNLSTNDILYCIEKCDKYLTPGLEYNAREFIIKTDIKIGADNWKGLDEADIENKKELRDIIDNVKKNTTRLDNILS